MGWLPSSTRKIRPPSPKKLLTVVTRNVDASFYFDVDEQFETTVEFSRRSTVDLVQNLPGGGEKFYPRLTETRELKKFSPPPPSTKGEKSTSGSSVILGKKNSKRGSSVILREKNFTLAWAGR